MKRLLTFGIAALLVLAQAGCAGIMTKANVSSSSKLFEKPPQELIDYINSKIDNANEKFSTTYQEIASYNGTMIRTYTSSINTLRLLLHEDTTDVLAIRLAIADRATVDQYTATAKAIAQITDNNANEEDVEDIVMYFKNYAKLKVDSKDIPVGSVTYSFGQEGSDYVFTVSKGPVPQAGWGKLMALKKMSFIGADDWEVYMDYEGLGSVYQTSSGLKISAIAAKLNIPLVNLDVEPDIVLTKPDTVAKYLAKGVNTTIKSLTAENKSWAVGEKGASEKTVSGAPGLESFFNLKDESGRMAMANKQLTLLTDDYSYTLFIERAGSLTTEDLKLYDRLVNSIQISK
ncbi:MAG: hypothetical protein LBC69_02185 [Eubacteriaceae bacterium]|nr:hypothetical protein [Eubacteriaceae bacterium]